MAIIHILTTRTLMPLRSIRILILLSSMVLLYSASASGTASTIMVISRTATSDMDLHMVRTGRLDMDSPDPERWDMAHLAATWEEASATEEASVVMEEASAVMGQASAAMEEATDKGPEGHRVQPRP